MSLRKTFAQIPTDQICEAFKEFEWPKLSWHGFENEDYKHLGGPEPDKSGKRNLYFTSAKTEIFQCMCERVNKPAPVLAGAAGRLQVLQEKFNDRLWKALGPLAEGFKEATLLPMHGRLRKPKPIPSVREKARDCVGKWEPWSLCDKRTN
eukprot:g6080.t1